MTIQFMDIAIQNIAAEFQPQWGPLVRKLRIQKILPEWWVPQHEKQAVRQCLLMWCRINSRTYKCRVLMRSTSENRRSHPLVPRGTSGAGQMGRGTTRPASIGSARPDYLQSCPGAVKQRYCTYPAHLATYCATLASTLPGASAAGARKGCASSGAYWSVPWSPKNLRLGPKMP
jgi:hypothetical protein